MNTSINSGSEEMAQKLAMFKQKKKELKDTKKVPLQKRSLPNEDDNPSKNKKPKLVHVPSRFLNTSLNQSLNSSMLAPPDRPSIYSKKSLTVPSTPNASDRRLSGTKKVTSTPVQITKHQRPASATPSRDIKTKLNPPTSARKPQNVPLITPTLTVLDRKDKKRVDKLPTNQISPIKPLAVPQLNFDVLDQNGMDLLNESSEQLSNASVATIEKPKAKGPSKIPRYNSPQTNTSPRENSPRGDTGQSASRKSSLLYKKREELQLMHVVLLQICCMNAKAEQSFVQQQEQAMYQMYNCWTIMQQQKSTTNEKEMKFGEEMRVWNLHNLLAVQLGPILDEMMSQFTHYQQIYVTFAKSLYDTAHRLPMHPSVHLNHDLLAETMQESAKVLQTMHEQLRFNFDKITQMKQSLEVLYSTVCESANEIETITNVDLQQLSTLDAQEKSLAMESIQLEDKRKSMYDDDDDVFSCRLLKESLGLL